MLSCEFKNESINHFVISQKIGPDHTPNLK